MNETEQRPGLLGWLLLLYLLLVSVGIMLEAYSAVRWGAVALLVAVLARREWELLPASLLLFLLFQGNSWMPDSVVSLPTAPFLIPFLLTTLICLPFSWFRENFSWFRRGEPDQVSWLLTGLTSLLSALALILWALWTDYLGIASSMLSTFRQVPFWFMLLVGIPGFALLNAFAEEVVYRGVLQHALTKRFTNGIPLVLAGQASAFAAAHYASGFPNGKLGFLMTFVYAVMLGYLRERSNGMLAPYVAHVAADFVIGLTLLLLAA